MLQIGEWLRNATKLLETSGIPSARLDALILLEDVTGKDRAWLLANADSSLDKSAAKKLQEWQTRRADHEPLAYIRGRSEFYGREFMVTPATLQPRPETETMLELFAEYMSDGNPPITEIVDVGTGTGAIAITAKLEWSDVNVYATEINEDALEVASKNAQKFGANVTFHHGSLLEPLVSDFLNPESSKLAILANLPYVPDSHTINQAAMQEPAIAIFGGTDGLDLYRQLFTQFSLLPSLPDYVLTESLPFQHKSLESIAFGAGYRLVKTQDFIQVFTPQSSPNSSSVAQPRA